MLSRFDWYLRLLALVGSALLLIGHAAAAAPDVPPARNVVPPIPEQALAVVQVRGVGPTKARLGEMLAAAAPDVAAAARRWFDTQVSELVGGRDTSRLDPDKRLLAVVTRFDNIDADTPPVAFLIPAADSKTFWNELLTAEEWSTMTRVPGRPDRFEAGGETVYWADLPAAGYVVLSPNEETASVFTKKYDRMELADIDQSIVDTFLNCDVGIYLNAKSINERYGIQIAGARQLARFALLPGGPAADQLSERQLEMVRLAVDGLFQSVADGRCAAAGVTFDPAGLAVRTEASFAADSAAAGVLADEVPAVFPSLSDLPTGHTVYSASQYQSNASKILNTFGQEFRAAAADPDASRLVDDYVAAAIEAQSSGVVRASRGPDASITVLTPADPGAFVRTKIAALEGLSADGEYSNVRLKQKPKIRRLPGPIGGFTVHEVRMVLDFAGTVKDVTDDDVRDTTIASMRRFVSETPVIWLGSDGKHVVEIAAADPEFVKKQLDEYLGRGHSVGRQLAFRNTLARLPDRASLVVVYDVSASLVALGDTLGDVVANVPGLPVSELPKLTPAGGDPAYLGVSVVLKPRSARMDIFVPAGAVKTARQVLEPAFQSGDNE